MGLLGKAALIGAGYYAYKHHQNKKRAERGELDMSSPNNHNQKRDAPNGYYPQDNKSQWGSSPDYYPRDSKAQLDYPQQQGNPSYASFGTDRKYEYASGAKN